VGNAKRCPSSPQATLAVETMFTNRTYNDQKVSRLEAESDHLFEEWCDMLIREQGSVSLRVPEPPHRS
jgi:hypothetical protein